MRKNSGQPLDASEKQKSDISETIHINPPQIAGYKTTAVDAEVRGDGAVSKTLTASALDEYVSGGGYVWLPRYIKALPFYVDDLSRDFGDDIYERMMLDAKVAAVVSVRKAAVLSQGVQINAATDIEETGANGKPKPASSPLAKEIADFCDWNLRNLRGRDFLAVMFEMLDAITLGHKIAEKVYEIQPSGKHAGKLRLKAIKVKPRRSTSFCVDVYMNVLGIIGLIPGQGAPVIVESIIGEPGQIPNILPREKFAVFSHRMKDADPRGTSDLRWIYEPWWFKRQCWGAYLSYLTVFGGGILVGTTAEDAQDTAIKDEYGNPTGAVVNPEQAMLQTLIEIKAGGAAAFPFGAKVEQLLHASDNSPYVGAIDLCDRQIAAGVLLQTLATEEGEHQTRAASGSHQDILGLLVRMDKNEAESFIRNEILYHLVSHNYGEEAADELTPTVNLGEVADHDIAAMITALGSAYASGYLHWSQLQGTDEMAGLPERNMQAVMQEQEEAKALAAQAAESPPATKQKDTTTDE